MTSKTPRGATAPGPSDSAAGAPRRRNRPPAPGRVEKAVSGALRAAREGGKADPRIAGFEALARAGARAMDDAQGQPYAIAQLLPKVADVLLIVTPVQQEQPDDLAALLADLARPTLAE